MIINKHILCQLSEFWVDNVKLSNIKQSSQVSSGETALHNIS